MKKILLVLSVFVLFIGAVFAEETGKSVSEESAEVSENFLSVQNLINDGIKKNFSQISVLSENLTEDEKIYFYEENKVPYWPIAVNAIGFGIGSYVQGNTVEAVLATVCDIIGYLSLTYFGLGYYCSVMGTFFGLLYPPLLEQSMDAIHFFETGMVISGAFLAVSRTISIISSIVYPTQTNRMLENALNPVKNTSEFTFVPVLTPDKNLGIAPGFVCSINF